MHSLKRQLLEELLVPIIQVLYYITLSGIHKPSGQRQEDNSRYIPTVSAANGIKTKNLK